MWELEDKFTQFCAFSPTTLRLDALKSSYSNWLVIYPLHFSLLCSHSWHIGSGNIAFLSTCKNLDVVFRMKAHIYRMPYCNYILLLQQVATIICLFLLADSNASRDKLCLKNDQDVLRQISREAELKQCFREREAATQALADNIQLQNCELKRNIEQLHVSLNKEREVKSNLQSSLDVSERKLTEAICKYERLQSDFITLGEENKKTVNEILQEKGSVDEALREAQADLDVQSAHFKKTRYDNDDAVYIKNPFIFTKQGVLGIIILRYL